MKNAMQLKAIIRNIAKTNHISAQLVMQNFMLERLLERISVSSYQQNFILKGGFLIGAIVGLNSRATMDMDATIKGWTVNEKNVKKMLIDICEIDLEDDVIFEFKSIGLIREGDDYDGYRVALLAKYPPMSVPLKLDITTGDKITPSEIEYQFQLLLEDRIIPVMAYNIETIMAEKLETVISRGNQNTRPRDYYDIYILAKLQSKNINIISLKEALKETSSKRGSTEVLKEYKDIMNDVLNNDFMNKQWITYQNKFEYAANISFEEVCEAVTNIMNIIDKA